MTRLTSFICGDFSLILSSDELQCIVLILISVTSALIGTFFVLRKMTMLANALSHTILPGIVLAYLAYNLFFHRGQQDLDFSRLLPSDSLLLVAAFLSALVTTFFAQTLVSYFSQQEDASIGMVFTFLFAVGVILVTCLTRSTHVGTELLMGNVDALNKEDMEFIFWIFLTNLSLIIFFWRPLFLASFDPLFAKMCGVSNTLVSYMLMAMCSFVAIGAFRAVGVLLFLAFLVTPTLIARLYTHNLKLLVLLSCLIAVVTSVVGVALSRHLLTVEAISCSSAGLIVVLLALIYGLSLAGVYRLRNGAKRNLLIPNDLSK